jgi:hypothetical protein
MIHELAGGEVIKGIFDAYPQPQEPVSILLRPARVNYLLERISRKRRLNPAWRNCASK